MPESLAESDCEPEPRPLTAALNLALALVLALPRRHSHGYSYDPFSVPGTQAHGIGALCDPVLVLGWSSSPFGL